jgi:hypothetical protein
LVAGFAGLGRLARSYASACAVVARQPPPRRSALRRSSRETVDGARPRRRAITRIDSAQERWRRFNGHELIADVLAGVRFKDGIRVTDDDTHDDEMTD